MPATAEDIEARLGVTLSSRHRAALLDPADPIHAQTLLLGPEGDAQRSLFAVNADLRAVRWKRWPDYLVAFATHGCGDYFALDTRTVPHRVYYIDPTENAPEGMAGCEQEGYVFAGFDAWYAQETRVASITGPDVG